MDWFDCFVIGYFTIVMVLVIFKYMLFDHYMVLDEDDWKYYNTHYDLFEGRHLAPNEGELSQSLGLPPGSPDKGRRMTGEKNMGKIMGYDAASLLSGRTELSPSEKDMEAALTNAGNFRGSRIPVEDLDLAAYQVSRFSGHRKNADEQEKFLALNLQPSDVVGGEHGLPIEEMRAGGYIPVPYSSIDGITTNEDLAINL